eukprot:8582669-Pyramimonas_sp.AAC.2
MDRCECARALGRRNDVELRVRAQAGVTCVGSFWMKPTVSVMSTSLPGQPPISDQSEATNQRRSIGGDQSEAINQRRPIRGDKSEATNQRRPIRGDQSEATNQRRPIRGDQSETTNQRRPIRGDQSEAHRWQYTRMPVPGRTV